MKEGQLKSSNRSGCLMYLALIYAFPMLAALAVLPLGVVYLCFRAGEIGNGLFVLAVEAGAVYLFIKYKRKGKKEEAPKNPNTAVLRTEAGGVQLGNPFRGVFVLGAAGSGKSESIAVPLLSEFVRMGFAGVVYDFKFPTLAKDVQSFVNAKGSVLRHFYLDFNNPAASYRVNPLNPRYLPNTSYAREYAQAIISNLMKESIKKPDFWTRSATDLLTACIWYLTFATSSSVVSISSSLYNNSFLFSSFSSDISSIFIMRSVPIMSSATSKLISLFIFCVEFL